MTPTNSPTLFQGTPPPDQAALSLVQAARHLTLEQIAVCSAIVALGVAAFFASRWGMGWLRGRYPGGLTDWLYALRWPIGSAIFYTALDRGLDVLTHLPAWFWPLKSSLYRLVVIIVAVGASIRTADLLVGIARKSFFSEELATDTEIHKVMTRIFRGIILFIAAVIILDNLGVKILGLLTAAGFLGGALALASKETLSNVLGYFAILADRIFRTGDRIAFEKYDGFVRERGLRSIRLEALSGELLTIPNTQLVNYPVRRLTSNEGLSLFGGWSKNLGADTDVKGPLYARGHNIDYLYRVAPRAMFTMNKLRFAAEVEYTVAAYGKVNGKAIVYDASPIGNLRTLLSAYYFF